MPTRRSVLQDLAIAVPFLAACGGRMRLAAPGRPALDGWARKVVALNRGLAAGEIGLSYWQDQIAALNAGLPVGEVVRYLDIDQLTAHFTYPDRLAQTADLHFPASVDVKGVARPWFLRAFAMREGGAIIPHAHNNMVSAHLVVHGNFHARTYDRVRDERDALMIRPSQNRLLGPGEIITMSDDRDNVHWLVSQRKGSMTFDIGMTNISDTRQYVVPANEYSMIYIDPAHKPERDGLIRAPVITFEQSAKKFAA